MNVPAPTRKPPPISRMVALTVMLAIVFGVATPEAARAWPEAPIAEQGWPTTGDDGFRYHVQPPLHGPVTLSATSFAIEYGPAFESALAVSSAILASERSGQIDVFAYVVPAQFAIATTGVNLGQTPDRSVLLDSSRDALLVNVTALQTRSPVQSEDAIRNAITLLSIRTISQGAAPSAFAAGLALYVQLPTSEYAARLASIVQEADKNDTLLTWFDLNRPPAGVDPELVLAQSYSIVSFLINRFDIPTLRSFLTSVTPESNWQEVMRTVYKNDSASLEQMWRANLKTWTVTGWRDNLMAAFDLQPARDLLSQGQYVSAKAVLEPSMNLYRQLNDATALADVQTLVNHADTGIQAEALMVEVEAALHTHDYVRASNLLDQAEIQYQALPADQSPGALLTTYRQRATDGLTALGRLSEAERLSDSWGSYPESRAAAKDAGATFALLGDEERLASAHHVMDKLDNRQRRLIGLLACLGLITLIWLSLWLRARGRAHVQWSYQ